MVGGYLGSLLYGDVPVMSCLPTLNFFRKRDNSLDEHLRTHKVLTKDQCFNLNYHKFSIKSYVLDVFLESPW